MKLKNFGKKVREAKPKISKKIIRKKIAIWKKTIKNLIDLNS